MRLASVVSWIICCPADWLPSPGHNLPILLCVSVARIQFLLLLAVFFACGQAQSVSRISDPHDNNPLLAVVDQIQSSWVSSGYGYGLGSVTLGCSRFFSFRCFYCLELEHDGDAATRSDSTPPARPSQYPPVDCRLEILLFSASERSSSCCFFAGGSFRDYFGDFVWSCRAVFGALLCAGLKYRLSRAPGTLPRGFLI